MIRRAPLASVLPNVAAVVAAGAAALAVACSAPAPPPDSASTTPTTSIVPTSDAGASSPQITFSDGTNLDGGVSPLLADGGIAGTCTPTATTPVAPIWKQPHALHRNVCTPQEAAAIVSCFVNNQNCDVLVSSACHQCSVSGDSTPYSSPLIVHDQTGQPSEVNVEGCVGAMMGDPSATGCGPKLAASNACSASACKGCTDQAGFQTCSTSAATGVCATSSAAAQCAAPYLSQCQSGSSILEVAFNLVAVFCGP